MAKPAGAVRRSQSTTLLRISYDRRCGIDVSLGGKPCNSRSASDLHVRCARRGHQLSDQRATQNMDADSWPFSDGVWDDVAAVTSLRRTDENADRMQISSVPCLVLTGMLVLPGEGDGA